MKLGDEPRTRPYVMRQRARTTAETGARILDAATELFAEVTRRAWSRPPPRGSARERRLAQLVAVCDVYTWKLLHRDSGLSRAQTRTALLELLEPMTTRKA